MMNFRVLVASFHSFTMFSEQLAKNLVCFSSSIQQLEDEGIKKRKAAFD